MSDYRFTAESRYGDVEKIPYGVLQEVGFFPDIMHT